ncbi:MAG: hypothetical protein K9I85_06150 [Saprospiraceae bacterium]|nr:hypothetical protein [Saprospiraceae bacterium]
MGSFDDSSWNQFRAQILKLTGKDDREEESSFPTRVDPIEMTYSQFNEFLLHLSFNRVSEEFFQVLVERSTDFESNSVLTIGKLTDGVLFFRKLFLLEYGDIRFGYKQLSICNRTGIATLKDVISVYREIEEGYYTSRHDQLIKIEPINGEDTFYLGYIAGDDLRKRLKESPESKELTKEKEKLERIIKAGTKNHYAYLSSDYLDVYVATSMRKKHEYLLTNELVSKVFSKSVLKKLKLRWFDPTQAYCSDRIDKGLSEALMLKRAQLTLYMAQESDTLGKDSELAVTLAQGKPVIAYIPEGSKSYVDDLLKKYMRMEGVSKREAIHYALQTFKSELPWKDKLIRAWLDEDANAPSEAEIMVKLYSVVEEVYNKRADVLKSVHPLGIQVNLNVGVATGVLVARNIEECAKLIESVILSKLEFDLIEVENHILLKERISKSVFRVMTKDQVLSNTFWNFYIN